MRTALAVSVAFAVAACGGNTTTAPSQTTPQFAGTWSGAATNASFTGGDCFASQLNGAIGASATLTLTLGQNGTSVAAAAGACSYSGTPNGNSVTLTMNAAQCNPPAARATNQCPTGDQRDVQLVSDVLTLTLNGTQLTGTAAETYNMWNTATGASLGSMVLNSTLALTKQ